MCCLCFSPVNRREHLQVLTCALETRPRQILKPLVNGPLQNRILFAPACLKWRLYTHYPRAFDPKCFCFVIWGFECDAAFGKTLVAQIRPCDLYRAHTCTCAGGLNINKGIDNTEGPMHAAAKNGRGKTNKIDSLSLIERCKPEPTLHSFFSTFVG